MASGSRFILVDEIASGHEGRKSDMTGSAAAAAVPDLPPDFVSRDRLLALLERDGPGVVVVRGPAGCGKTALLADWARGQGTTAWLRPSPPRAGSLKAQITAALAEPPPPTRLVIDDVDELDTADLRDLADLVRHPPPGVRCVLAGRRPRALATAVRTVQAAQLALTPTEASALLAACGVPLDAARVRRLQERTGGWVMAMRLAAIILRRGEDPDHLLTLLGDVGDRQNGKHSEAPTDLAVIRMLPSRRSAAQIADHLRVSIPVARARMHAAYTALGTSSRRGAVLAAQERGLLP
jgi:LuxR family transcriptional regulator, maltose regulon positive regulatory protein